VVDRSRLPEGLQFNSSVRSLDSTQLKALLSSLFFI
jgi:hypothetical protein